MRLLMVIVLPMYYHRQTQNINFHEFLGKLVKFFSVTGGSQPSNRGSIPRIAISFSLCNLLKKIGLWRLFVNDDRRINRKHIGGTPWKWEQLRRNNNLLAILTEY